MRGRVSFRVEGEVEGRLSELIAGVEGFRGYTRIAFIERKSSVGALFATFYSLDEFKDVGSLHPASSL